MVQYEFDQIKDLVENKIIPPVTLDELKSAIKTLNKGKAADINGIMIEHVVYGGEALVAVILNIINAIFTNAVVPDALKVGLLTSIYKNKVIKLESKYYLGITILPVLCKIIDSILKQRVSSQLNSVQSTLQRGLTKGTSPLKAALILEEARRESKDQKKPFILVLLDAKSAFDVVKHKNMMRCLYHYGINNKHWTVINSLHTNAMTAVNWRGRISDPFKVERGSSGRDHQYRSLQHLSM